MADTVSYYSVVAQVIPVIFIALLIEAGLIEPRRFAGASGKPPKALTEAWWTLWNRALGLALLLLVLLLGEAAALSAIQAETLSSWHRFAPRASLALAAVWIVDRVLAFSILATIGRRKEIVGDITLVVFGLAALVTSLVLLLR